MQANKSGTVFFLTLTYRNEMLPIAHTSLDSGTRKIEAFGRGFDGSADVFKNRVIEAADGSAVAYSLCRNDIKLWLKYCRREWSRTHKGEKLDFAYLVCGEYGEKRGRPHYHGLFYGLSRAQVDFMCSVWEDRYGFSLVRPQTGSLSVSDASKVSNYVSKYMNKGTYSAWLPLLPYVEQPRRQSSLHFGLTDDETILQISNFIKVAICVMIYYLDGQLLIRSAASLIGKNYHS